MFTLLYGFTVGMVSLAGTAVLLGLMRVVLVQVRGVRRIAAQLGDPVDRLGLPWEFADCGQPPGWLPPPERDDGHLELWQR